MNVPLPDSRAFELQSPPTTTSLIPPPIGGATAPIPGPSDSTRSTITSTSTAAQPPSMAFSAFQPPPPAGASSWAASPAESVYGSLYPSSQPPAPSSFSSPLPSGPQPAFAAPQQSHHQYAEPAFPSSRNNSLAGSSSTATAARSSATTTPMTTMPSMSGPLDPAPLASQPMALNLTSLPSMDNPAPAAMQASPAGPLSHHHPSFTPAHPSSDPPLHGSDGPLALTGLQSLSSHHPSDSSFGHSNSFAPPTMQQSNPNLSNRALYQFTLGSQPPNKPMSKQDPFLPNVPDQALLLERSSSLTSDTASGLFGNLSLGLSETDSAIRRGSEPAFSQHLPPSLHVRASSHAWSRASVPWNQAVHPDSISQVTDEHPGRSKRMRASQSATPHASHHTCRSFNVGADPLQGSEHDPTSMLQSYPSGMQPTSGSNLWNAPSVSPKHDENEGYSNVPSHEPAFAPPSYQSQLNALGMQATPSTTWTPEPALGHDSPLTIDSSRRPTLRGVSPLSGEADCSLPIPAPEANPYGHPQAIAPSTSHVPYFASADTKAFHVGKDHAQDLHSSLIDSHPSVDPNATPAFDRRRMSNVPPPDSTTGSTRTSVDLFQHDNGYQHPQGIKRSFDGMYRSFGNDGKWYSVAPSAWGQGTLPERFAQPSRASADMARSQVVPYIPRQSSLPTYLPLQSVPANMDNNRTTTPSVSMASGPANPNPTGGKDSTTKSPPSQQLYPILGSLAAVAPDMETRRESVSEIQKHTPSETEASRRASLGPGAISMTTGPEAKITKPGNTIVRCNYIHPLSQTLCNVEFHRLYDLQRHRETIHAKEEARMVRDKTLSMDQCLVLGKEVALNRTSLVAECRCDGVKGCGSLFSRRDALLRHKRLRDH